MMKAVIQEEYGSPAQVLHLGEIDMPVVRDDQVLVRVHAASIHPDVWHVVTGRPYVLRLMGAGLRRPKTRVPGTDLAGFVESVGKKVTRFRPGDQVFGESHMEWQWRNGGAFAEYAAVPEDALAHKPTNVTFSEAASVPTSGIIALLNLRGGELVKPGQRVLVNGAAGNVGSIALQLARAFGAHVTGVDSGDKLELVRALGAERVIDYTREDFTRGTARYDLIFDVASTLQFEDCKRVLTATGLYVRIGHEHFGAAGGPMLGAFPSLFKLSMRSGRDPHLARMDDSFPGKRPYMELLGRLLAAGKLTPIIDKVFPLSGVADAIRYLASGQALGKIMIAPQESFQ